MKTWYRCINPDLEVFNVLIAEVAPRGFYDSDAKALMAYNKDTRVATLVSKLIVLAKNVRRCGYLKEAMELHRYADALDKIGTPEVEIDPQLGTEVKEAIERIKKNYDPNFFNAVSKVVLLSSGPFGQVSSEEPSVVKVNLPKIRDEVRRQLNTAFAGEDVQFNPADKKHQEIFDEVLTRAIVEVVSHETGHVKDYKVKPEGGSGDFPGGEGRAEQEEKRVSQTLENKTTLV